MDEERAVDISGTIINLTGASGWQPDECLELTKQVQMWTNDEATVAVVEALSTWSGNFHPSVSQVNEFYRSAHRLSIERRRDQQWNRPFERIVPPAEGREIAYRAYLQETHRPDDDESRTRFEAYGANWENYVESTSAPDEDVVLAMAAIGAGAMYKDIHRDVFHGDHLRAARALRVLEKSGRIVHRGNGWITAIPRRADGP